MIPTNQYIFTYKYTCRFISIYIHTYYTYIRERAVENGKGEREVGRTGREGEKWGGRETWERSGEEG